MARLLKAQTGAGQTLSATLVDTQSSSAEASAKRVRDASLSSHRQVGNHPRVVVCFISMENRGAIAGKPPTLTAI